MTHNLLIAWAFIGPSVGMLAGLFWAGRATDDMPENLAHEGHREADQAWADYEAACRREADEIGIPTTERTIK